MTARTKLEKYGSVALGLVCIFLGYRLISEIGGSPVEAARGQQAPAASSAAQPANSPKPLRKEIAKLASADPNLEIQTLKEYVTRPLPENPRDPFDFGAPPPSPARQAAKGGAGGAGGIAGNAPPPPPRIPLQALGYSVRAGIGGEAYLADNEQVYIVHQGDLVSKQYKILKVTSRMVEVRDESSGQTAQLPIPDAQ